MRFAIVESGGKQYRAVEGRAIEVDRLSVETGKQFNLERVLLMADGDEIMVGTPTVDGVEVKVTALEHVKGPKLISFRYRPKKRIRVKSGHRQQYTRLMVDFIGKPGEVRKVEEPVVEEQPMEIEAAIKAEEKEPRAKQGRSEPKPKKEATPSSKGKSFAKRAPAKKSTASKSSAKKTDKK
ncbi:MAG: 50S ribosomal protein L21 [Anaerolineales bacterium]|nr:50S ribosomal protein L21 [Anaerolineales bacterium]